MGVTRDPLHFFGRMRLEGRIHLWFIGLGASAELRIDAPSPLFVKGEVCGSVDLWFTEIEGCVDITIGSEPGLPDPQRDRHRAVAAKPFAGARRRAGHRCRPWTHRSASRTTRARS